MIRANVTIAVTHATGRPRVIPGSSSSNVEATVLAHCVDLARAGLASLSADGPGLSLSINVGDFTGSVTVE
jgi:hypothetical protein